MAKKLKKEDRNGEFIEAVRGHLILYDKTNPDYKDQRKKNLIWETLANEFDLGRDIIIFIYNCLRWL